MQFTNIFMFMSYMNYKMKEYNKTTILTNIQIMERIRAFKLFKRISKKKVCTVYIFAFRIQYWSIILYVKQFYSFSLKILLILYFCLRVSRLWIIYASNSDLISLTMCNLLYQKYVILYYFLKEENWRSVLAIAHLSIALFPLLVK